MPGVATTNEFEWNAARQRTKKTDTDGTAYLLRDGRRSRSSVPQAPRSPQGRARSPRVVGPRLADVSRGATVCPTYDMLGRLSMSSVPPAPRPPQGRARSPRAVGLGLADVSRGGPFGYVGALGYYNDPDLAMPLLSIRHYAMGRGMFIARDPILTEPRYGYVYGLPGVRVDPGGDFGAGTIVLFALLGKLVLDVGCWALAWNAAEGHIIGNVGNMQHCVGMCLLCRCSTFVSCALTVPASTCAGGLLGAGGAVIGSWLAAEIEAFVLGALVELLGLIAGTWIPALGSGHISTMTGPNWAGMKCCASLSESCGECCARSLCPSDPWNAWDLVPHPSPF